MLAMVLGIVFGVPGFTCVHFVMHAVDWLDNLMETKPPQDELGGTK